MVDKPHSTAQSTKPQELETNFHRRTLRSYVQFFRLSQNPRPHRPITNDNPVVKTRDNLGVPVFLGHKHLDAKYEEAAQTCR